MWRDLSIFDETFYFVVGRLMDLYECGLMAIPLIATMNEIYERTHLIAIRCFKRFFVARARYVLAPACVATMR